MKKVTLGIGGLTLVLLLVACGASSEVGNAPTTESVALSEAYEDALPLPAQLALGSLQLEETDLAINKAQADQLLPLWQAYQTLSVGDKTAEAELSALVKQIQGAMSAEQIATIAEMRLTTENATELMGDLVRAMGRGDGSGALGREYHRALWGQSPLVGSQRVFTRRRREGLCYSGRRESLHGGLEQTHGKDHLDREVRLLFSAHCAQR